MIVEFDGVLIKDSTYEAYYCEFPYQVEKLFAKKRVKIICSIDGVEYRGLLTPMKGLYRIMMNKTIRDKVAKNVGDTVHIRVKEDTQPRTVELPEDFEITMTESMVKPFFDSLSFSHQKEYVEWIISTKKEATRKARIYKAVEMLKNKIKSR